MLYFEACDWESEVWIDGKEAGMHRGGYGPFALGKGYHKIRIEYLLESARRPPSGLLWKCQGKREGKYLLNGYSGRKTIPGCLPDFNTVLYQGSQCNPGCNI